VRDFAIPSWELDRYTRHRTVAFDRKFKDTLEVQVQQLKTQRARREACSARLAEHLAERPPEVAHLLELESKALEVSKPTRFSAARRVNFPTIWFSREASHSTKIWNS
jgi:hypothetical protein